eukprot:4766352-Prymnesium_polylepis.1
MLANLAKEKKISLCGITPDQTVTNLRPKDKYRGPFMKPADAILLTADLAVRGFLTECTLLQNELDVETAIMLAKISKEKQISLCGITPNQASVDFTMQRLQPADA